MRRKSAMLQSGRTAVSPACPVSPLSRPARQVAELADAAHGYVAADLAALCSEAALTALRRVVTSERGGCGGEQPCSVTLADFQAAETRTRPSAMRELAFEIPKVDGWGVGWGGGVGVWGGTGDSWWWATFRAGGVESSLVEQGNLYCNIDVRHATAVIPGLMPPPPLGVLGGHWWPGGGEAAHPGGGGAALQGARGAAASGRDATPRCACGSGVELGWDIVLCGINRLHPRRALFHKRNHVAVVHA